MSSVEKNCAQKHIICRKILLLLALRRRGKNWSLIEIWIIFFRSVCPTLQTAVSFILGLVWHSIRIKFSSSVPLPTHPSHCPCSPSSLSSPSSPLPIFPSYPSMSPKHQFLHAIQGSVLSCVASDQWTVFGARQRRPLSGALYLNFESRSQPTPP